MVHVRVFYDATVIKLEREKFSSLFFGDRLEVVVTKIVISADGIVLSGHRPWLCGFPLKVQTRPLLTDDLLYFRGFTDYHLRLVHQAIDDSLERLLDAGQAG